MLRNRISILLAFICTSFVATSVSALTPAEELYEQAWQSTIELSTADRLRWIITLLKIDFVFPENSGSLNLQCAASTASELSPKAFLLVYKESLVSVLSRLQEKAGNVGVDSLLFAQIAAMLLDGKGNEGKFNLIKGTASPLDLTFVSDRKFVHLIPEHNDAKRFFSNSPWLYRSGEAWLLDVGDETWAGMTRAGPRSQKYPDWIETIRNDCKLECKERRSVESSARAMASDLLINIGRFDKWTVEQ